MAKAKGDVAASVVLKPETQWQAPVVEEKLELLLLAIKCMCMNWSILLGVMNSK